MMSVLPADERDRRRDETIAYVQEQLRPLFNPSIRVTRDERSKISTAIFGRNNEILRTVLSQPDIDAIEDMLNAQVAHTLDDWRAAIGAQDLSRYQRVLMLQTINQEWQQYLTAMEDMRQGIGLQAIGQRDPLVQYQTEGYRMFQELLNNIDQTIVRSFFPGLPRYRQQIEAYQVSQSLREKVSQSGYELAGFSRRGRGHTLRRETRKVGRNEDCPCGSGKKYKYCHGRADGGSGELAEVAVAEEPAGPVLVGQEADAPAAPRGRSVPAESGNQKPARGRATPSSGQSSPQRGRKVTKK
jgi:preprotein translocase subunit SecA